MRPVAPGPLGKRVEKTLSAVPGLSAKGARFAVVPKGRLRAFLPRLANGDVLIVGGSDARDYDGKLRSVERFDVAAGRFVPAGELADARFKIADGLLLLPGGRVLVAAGDVAPEIFDVASGKGTRLAYDLGGQWNYMTLTRANADTALLAGGYREGRIEPTNRSWIIHLSGGAS